MILWCLVWSINPSLDVTAYISHSWSLAAPKSIQRYAFIRKNLGKKVTVSITSIEYFYRPVKGVLPAITVG